MPHLALLLLIISCLTKPFFANDSKISIFPIDKYNQSTSCWIKPGDRNHNIPLLDKSRQKKHLEIFRQHFYKDKSVWSSSYIKRQLNAKSPDDFMTFLNESIRHFNNNTKHASALGYGENYRLRTKQWIDSIASNMNLSQFRSMQYQPGKRAITTDNLHARALPTDDVFFYHYRIAGEGYPFDNLQISSLWIGTPVYVLGETKDHAWLLVMTPDFVAWVKSKGIAYADEKFIMQWQKLANKRLAAITKSNTSLMSEKKSHIAYGYLGSLFPASIESGKLKLFVPVKQADDKASLIKVTTNNNEAVLMPLVTTPYHFSWMIENSKGRTYSWGGKEFYNDCSAELKSLFTPFGIWLPRHSSEQAKAGLKIDLSSLTPEQRLSSLQRIGKPLLTLIYVGNHIMLYIGNYQDNDNHQIITYQNVWGLHPNPPTRRAVIGKAVFIPLLLKFPEDRSLQSQAAQDEFIITLLDETTYSSKTVLAK